MPNHSPTSPRSHSGKGLCHRLLWHPDPARSNQGASREVRHTLGRLGRERPQFPALPVEQLSASKRRGRMRRHFDDLRPADRSAIDSVPDGLFLVRVDRVQYRWHAQKPYYSIRFAVIEPRHLAGCLITGRLYCTARAMWKLSWFLRDFGYDTELLGKDEIDDQALVGLMGVLKVSHAIVHGISVLNLDGFAQAARWQELSPTMGSDLPGSEAA